MLFIFIGLMFLANSHAQTNVPHFTGNKLDLLTLKTATLYKGSENEWIADNLDVAGVHSMVKNKPDVWLLTLTFTASKATIHDRDTWLQLRSNIDAAEVFINNQLVLVNGKVGDSLQSEIQGKSVALDRISKEHLVAGTNRLSVRFSNFQHPQGAIFRDLEVGHKEVFERASTIMSSAPLLFSGIFLLVVFVNIALYFSLNRQTVFALLALLFSLNFTLMANETLYWQGMLASNSMLDNYSLRGLLETLIYFILLLALHQRFSFGSNRFYAAVILFFMVYVVASLADLPRSMLLSCVPLVYGLFKGMKAIKKHKLVLASVALVVLFEFIDEYNWIEGFDFVFLHPFITSLVFKLDDLGMVLFAVTMIFVSAKAILEQTQALSRAELKLANLEFQFVQKHIQPHFLMNTLMSLQQLVRKEPQVACEMIEALSEEFHLLTTMAKQPLVDITQEIEMCRTHLTIMSIQQNADYQLQTQGIVGNEQIPPAVFHTLVENGITHGYSGIEPALFILSKTTTADATHFRMFNNGRVKETTNRVSGGSGLNYIEARLEAWKPGLWTLKSGPVDGGWQTDIEIQATL